MCQGKELRELRFRVASPIESSATMSEMKSASPISGPTGTAAVRALDKTGQSNSQQNKAREARIAELKQQYESGRYVVDSMQLSSAIVASLLNDRD